MRVYEGRVPRTLRWIALLAVAVVAGACVDERIVFVERSLFDDPPEGAAGFLGYSNVEAKRTVCGNCHIGRQREWEQTAHARAYATLEASPAAQTFCQACHTVSSRGNQVEETNVGWVATSSPRYRDVQCEACHGPGLNHVTTPDAPGNQPVATLSLGADVTRGCAECHSGVHRPFAEEWADSRHGNVRASPAGNPNCAVCHEAKGALAAWGVKSIFSEQDMAGHLPITCGVCHDPHDARHSGQLRFAVDVPVVEQNLCMKCHQQRGAPDPASFRGPHAPEGPLLLGLAGWVPPNMEHTPGTLVGTHGGEANPRLCASCHVTDYQMRDPETDAFVFRATGHSFQAIPCVDADGIPQPDATCSLTDRSFRSCLDGCHGTETAARTALIVARDRINDLIDELDALLAQIPASEFEQPGIYSTADGALFNLGLARFRGSDVHNPFLIEALLRGSVRQVRADYDVSPSGNVPLDAQLTPPPHLRGQARVEEPERP